MNAPLEKIFHILCVCGIVGGIGHRIYSTTEGVFCDVYDAPPTIPSLLYHLKDIQNLDQLRAVSSQASGKRTQALG